MGAVQVFIVYGCATTIPGAVFCVCLLLDPVSCPAVPTPSLGLCFNLPCVGSCELFSCTYTIPAAVCLLLDPAVPTPFLGLCFNLPVSDPVSCSAVPTPFLQLCVCCWILWAVQLCLHHFWSSILYLLLSPVCCLAVPTTSLLGCCILCVRVWVLSSVCINPKSEWRWGDWGCSFKDEFQRLVDVDPAGGHTQLSPTRVKSCLLQVVLSQTWLVVNKMAVFWGQARVCVLLKSAL